jgi:hypothetical protein
MLVSVTRSKGAQPPSPAARLPRALGLLFVVTGCGPSSTTGALAGIAGTACANPIDLTQGTTFQGDTCDGGVPIPVAPCATSSPAIVFGVAPQAKSWRRQFHVTQGFAVLEAAIGRCTLTTGLCDGGGDQGGGVPQGEPFYLAVARADGTCGPFTLDVYNATFCNDTADASTCRCGDSPSCPQGQTCQAASMPPYGMCMP